jgi:hypothetical protein
MGDDGRIGEAERDGFVERSRDESTFPRPQRASEAAASDRFRGAPPE